MCARTRLYPFPLAPSSKLTGRSLDVNRWERGAGTVKIRNPKHRIRNKCKAEKTKAQNGVCGVSIISHLDFVFVSDLVLRISCFLLLPAPRSPLYNACGVRGAGFPRLTDLTGKGSSP